MMHDLDSLIAELQEIRKKRGKNMLIVGATGIADEHNPQFYDFSLVYNEGDDIAANDELAIAQPHLTIVLDSLREFKFNVGERVNQEGDPIIPEEVVTIVSRRWEIDLDTNKDAGREMYQIHGPWCDRKTGWSIGVDCLSRLKIDDV